MGTTIGLTGAAVVLVKRGAIRVFAGAQKERDSKIRKIVEVSGAAVLFLFGLILFLAQL
jgi:ABC-type nickel/cobalt efflux system permease component RcnA